MIDRNYRWVIVIAGALLGCVAIGAMFSLPVFLTPMTKATGWSRTGISSAMTIGFLAMAVGSIAWGTVSDRYGPRLAALFGFTYAGVMPLYAVIARENFPLRMMGTVIGGTAMAGSLGMSTGPLLGGWIFDTTHSYGWLYIASFGMGVGALLIGATFRPFPKAPQPETLQAAE